MPENQTPSDISPEFARLQRDAVVGETAPERVSEKPGLALSGGEENNSPVRG
jgi:hypothetical protein